MSTLITESEIKEAVVRLGKQISDDYRNIEQPLLVIGLLKGCFIFMADLVREINIPLQVDFMMVSSYENNIQDKEVKIILDLNTPIKGRDVLILEDILDTGRTFTKVLDILGTRNPRSLKTCALLDKKECRIVDVELDYSGIDIPDKYVYGYGLDDSQLNRNLKTIDVKEV